MGESETRGVSQQRRAQVAPMFSTAGTLGGPGVARAVKLMYNHVCLRPARYCWTQ